MRADDEHPIRQQAKSPLELPDKVIDASRIRAARVDERVQLEALQWKASLNNAGDRQALLAHPDAIALPVGQIVAGRVFVAEINHRIIGFSVCLPRPDGNFELDGLFVDPDIWQRAVGRSLLAHCVKDAVASGAASLSVVGNPHAQGFYEACGFKVIEECATRFGPGLIMRSDISELSLP